MVFGVNTRAEKRKNKMPEKAMNMGAIWQNKPSKPIQPVDVKVLPLGDVGTAIYPLLGENGFNNRFDLLIVEANSA